MPRVKNQGQRRCSSVPLGQQAHRPSLHRAGPSMRAPAHELLPLGRAASPLCGPLPRNSRPTGRCVLSEAGRRVAGSEQAWRSLLRTPGGRGHKQVKVWAGLSSGVWVVTPAWIRHLCPAEMQLSLSIKVPRPVQSQTPDFVNSQHVLPCLVGRLFSSQTYKFCGKIEAFYKTTLETSKCYLIQLIFSWCFHKFD